MPKCSVLGCKNHSFLTKGKKIHYFRFPKSPNRLNQWMEFCKKPVNVKNGAVCSAHFAESAFTNTYKARKALGFLAKHRDYLNSNAVPTIPAPVLTSSPINETELAIPVVNNAYKETEVLSSEKEKVYNKVLINEDISNGHGQMEIEKQTSPMKTLGWVGLRNPEKLKKDEETAIKKSLTLVAKMKEEAAKQINIPLQIKSGLKELEDVLEVIRCCRESREKLDNNARKKEKVNTADAVLKLPKKHPITSPDIRAKCLKEDFGNQKLFVLSKPQSNNEDEVATKRRRSESTEQKSDVMVLNKKLKNSVKTQNSEVIVKQTDGILVIEILQNMDCDVMSEET